MHWVPIGASLLLIACENRNRPGAEGPSLTSKKPNRRFNLSNLQVDPKTIHPGGPPKDGIPALTTAAARAADRPDRRMWDGERPPAVVPIDRVEAANLSQRVIGVELNGAARAYPLKILNWHEAVNDRLGGEPVLVVYCPLCDSASVSSRVLNGRTYEFGISGLLHNSNVLLYDRTDHALWSQLGFTAISGPNAGQALQTVGRWAVTTLKMWADRHPDSTVLSESTGFYRHYQRDAYADYHRSDRLVKPVSHRDRRLANKQRVLGVRLGDRAKAYPLRAIAEAGGRVRDTFAGHTIELASDGENGRVLEAPPEARTAQTYWFAWVAFWPDTDLFSTEKPASTSQKPDRPTQ